MLHKLNRIRGFHLNAVDGEIGHVDDVLFEEGSWRLQYLVVDTSNLVGGKWVAISPSAVTRIDWSNSQIDVALTREEIKNGPKLESLDVPNAEALPNYAYIF